MVNVKAEPADELWGRQRHCGVAARTFETVIFDAEGNAVCIETDQAAVRNSYPMLVARQIGQHGLWSCEGFFGSH